MFGVLVRRRWKTVLKQESTVRSEARRPISETLRNFRQNKIYVTVAKNVEQTA